uniref:Uncharacterized protein n=1 Tax=Petromyzon marinus TaxID=7757 RepID=S4RAW1_PETMA
WVRQPKLNMRTY